MAAGAAVEISLPWIAQRGATECGRAVLASLAARHGGKVEEFYARLPAPPDQARGYSVAEMQGFGAGVGVTLTPLSPRGVVIAGECLPKPAVTAYFRRLAGIVAGGQPVVIPVRSGADSGHYLVLVRSERGSFSVLDPAAPGLRQIAGAQLAPLMCDFGYVALVSR
jgi:hypothetical protein